MSSRPWTTDELAAGNVLRFPNPRARHPERHLNPRDVPDLPTPGRLYRLPHTQDSVNALFRESGPHTREVIRQVARLGYDVEEIANGRVELDEVGRGRMMLTLFLSDEFPLEIVQVKFGTQRWTARQAALWLRKRAAR